MPRPSLIGFVVGAICAIIFFVVMTAILSFRYSSLVFGLVALLIWAGFTFNFHRTRV